MKSALHLVPKIKRREFERRFLEIAPPLDPSGGGGAIEADSPVRAGRNESAFLEEFLAVDCLAKARDYLAVEWRRGYSRSIANLQARQILNDCLSRLVDKIQNETEGA